MRMIHEATEMGADIVGWRAVKTETWSGPPPPLLQVCH